VFFETFRWNLYVNTERMECGNVLRDFIIKTFPQVDFVCLYQEWRVGEKDRIDSFQDAITKLSNSPV